MRKSFMSKRNGNRGMTLVELMCVMVILSVVMLAVMSLYIPAQRSTVTQTQVSDVQSNLRLALRVMTRDLLMAGFLMPHEPIAFPSIGSDVYLENPDSEGTKDTSEFFIRTRAVGSKNFARIASVPSRTGNRFTLTISEKDMIEDVDGNPFFPQGTRVRLFSPIGASEINAAVGSDAERAHEVFSYSATSPYTIVLDIQQTLSTPQLDELKATLLPETVMIKISDENQPPLQTIQYKLANGILERIVNQTNRQILARNIDTSDTSLGGTSYFDYVYDSDGRINRVDIKLSGITAAGKAGTLSAQKTREVQTSVKLRNVQ